MKKIFIIIIFCILLCGCQEKEKYKEYTYYDLKDKKTYGYTFHDDNGNKHSYTIADITDSPTSELYETGLFYKISNDSYIKIYNLDMCRDFKYSEYFQVSKSAYFYQNIKKGENTLYINSCTGFSRYKITLNEEKVEAKFLNYDTSKISSDSLVRMDSIRKVDDDFIYYDATIEKDRQYINIKCSLDTYICELTNE